jgi:AmiR/NasT family two-component response regulator
MTSARLIQNFRGLRGVLWGNQNAATEPLKAGLARLGMTLFHASDVDPATVNCHRDVLLVDGDCPVDASLGLSPGSVVPSAPAIGLVGVEAPSRLKALSDIGVTAFLRKPIHASAIYSSLFLAVNGYHRLRGLEQQIADHESRRRGRRFVIKAVVHLVQTTGITDDEAYALLRRESMQMRIAVEDYAEQLMAEQLMAGPLARATPVHDAGASAAVDPHASSRPDMPERVAMPRSIGRANVRLGGGWRGVGK